MTETLFILACILGFGSWFIAIVEMIATHSFLRLAFNIGIPIHRCPEKFYHSVS